MSCQQNSNCTCGCCSGVTVLTPQGESNAPGLSAIAYRTGTWATFRESMQARLSSPDYPALAGLKTRESDDFSVALLDASSVVLDILSFYQERLANEGYLRTATQLYSLTKLSQLIGYQPSPGVSASAYLAFTFSAATGLPDNPKTTATTIPAGTQVQSVPAQGQTPQTFQTSADILGKPDWNALPVQTGKPPKLVVSMTSLYLAGTSTQLQVGDSFLIAGDVDAGKGTTDGWMAAVISSVTPDTLNRRTLITWTDVLDSNGTLSKNAKFYALRQRASLYGYNAPKVEMLISDMRSHLHDIGLTKNGEWIFDRDDVTRDTLSSEYVVDLDAVYSKLTAGGWIVMVRPDRNSSGELGWAVHPIPVKTIRNTTRADFGTSGKITRLTLPTPTNSTQAGNMTTRLKNYYHATRRTSVLIQSEELTITEHPLDYPLYGTLLDLEMVRQDLVGARAVAVIGKSHTMTVNEGAALTFVPDDNSETVDLQPGDLLTIVRPPLLFKDDGSIPSWSTNTQTITLLVADSSGRSGNVTAKLSEFTFVRAADKAPVTQEVAEVSSIMLITKPFAHTRIVLKNPLLNCYDRSVTAVNANVGVATAGSPVTELLGNGSASTPNQIFTLRQTPLTYIQAQTPTGRAGSMDVKVNGASWTEVQTLYGQSPNAQVFKVTNLTGGSASIQFGDGVEGATLPTGQSNIIANYRVGIGAAGNVPGASITTLMDRPLGVKSVVNPMAASGGQNAQSLDDIRANAPQTVLTLGRAVSLADYQNFAATFAGIAKATAMWIPNGSNRGVFVTVAGVGGAALPPGNLTLKNLTDALKDYSNPHVSVCVQSFYETLFSLKADIAYDPAYDMKTVKAAVTSLLNSTYSFAARSFGMGVSGDEIAALLQSVSGVVAVNVTRVKVVATSAAGDLGDAAFSVSAWNNWIAQQTHVKRRHAGSTRICPYTPAASLTELPTPAEVLVLDPNPSSVVLGVM